MSLTFFVNCIKTTLAASLRHVQVIILLGLLRKLRYHSRYSGAIPIALQLALWYRQSPFAYMKNYETIHSLWHDRVSDTTFILYYIL
ncbi:hypothetical protein IR083_04060 [Dysgonomonas sp. GY75]|uniref:hypothetical protein n=1 Tax=Dysgonomonas sp. GY75 TaxID=2780419 RepID=UPI0018847EB7|nr:hypothetical protein [Dysgonomonas sp. GY75]MBF0647987.1 hypothetical protein [Dysgonomonas sp. GY75]